ATESNRKHFESQKVQLEGTNLKKREEAEAVAKKLDGFDLLMIRQSGETGHLYGSVSGRDIVETLGEQGFTVARQQVQLGHAIKVLGIYDCRIALHPEVIISIKINVAKTEEEARSQVAAAKVEEQEAAEDALEAKKAKKKAKADEAEAATEDATEAATDKEAAEAEGTGEETKEQAAEQAPEEKTD
ncbi:MAG: 50S ribosomal protein L9, partial [Rhodospirillaceae bacterium]|nr:50S ribosomal protein L9 [Rhodospirillaceae bacterium]